MIKIQCIKCGGTGYIEMYSGIAGGICFSCDGKGYKFVKNKPVETKEWVIFAIEKESGKEFMICTIKEKTRKKALSKAKNQLSKGNGYYAESARIEEK